MACVQFRYGKLWLSSYKNLPKGTKGISSTTRFTNQGKGHLCPVKCQCKKMLFRTLQKSGKFFKWHNT